MTKAADQPRYGSWATVFGITLCLTVSALGADTPRKPEVTKITLPEGESSAHLGGSIFVTVSNLDVLLQEVQQEKSKIVLYLNDRMMPGVPPTAIDLAEGRLTFDLIRTDASKPAWAEVLYPPWGRTKDVSVSVGTATGAIKRTSAATIPLTSIAMYGSLWITAVLFVFACVMFGWLATTSNILRDSGEEPVDPDTRKPWRKPFSLARTQMAFWFFIVLASYLLIFAVTGERDTIPPEVLALLGISASTALGAVIIDASKDAAAKSELEATKREIDALSAQLTVAESGANPNVDDVRALKERRKLLYAKVAPASNGFFLDLLSDVNGISLNRFQMMVWTMVLGVIFLSAVVYNLGMPTFGGTLLAIMGISGGTYLGFKFPEAKK